MWSGIRTALTPNTEKVKGGDDSMLWPFWSSLFGIVVFTGVKGQRIDVS